MRIFLFLAISFLMNCCDAPTSTQSEDVRETILKLIDADNRSDLKTVLECYSDTIAFYPIGRQSISGIASVRKSYEELFSKSKLNLATQILDIKIFEDEALVKGLNTGSKTNRMDSTVAPLHDNYIALLVKGESGKWKITKLIWGF